MSLSKRVLKKDRIPPSLVLAMLLLKLFLLSWSEARSKYSFDTYCGSSSES